MNRIISFLKFTLKYPLTVVISAVMLLFFIGQCQSVQEKELENAYANALSYKSNACPNYGILTLDEIKQATFINGKNEEKVMFIVPGEWDFSGVIGRQKPDRYLPLAVSEATGALKISSMFTLDKFIEQYKVVCGDIPIPYWDKIAYNIYINKLITDMASSLKIKPEEILDLRIKKNREDFVTAWFNKRENPSLNNYSTYEGNEFQYETDKESFKKIRNYKYIITRDYSIWGDYDFKRKGYHFTAKHDFETTIQFRAGDGMVVPNELCLPSKLLFEISSEKAEKFKKQRSDEVISIVLSKISPKIYFNLDGKGYIGDGNKPPKRKLLYFSVETLKYYVQFDGEIYKNY